MKSFALFLIALMLLASPAAASQVLRSENSEIPNDALEDIDADRELQSLLFPCRQYGDDNAACVAEGCVYCSNFADTSVKKCTRWILGCFDPRWSCAPFCVILPPRPPSSNVAPSPTATP